MPDPWTLTALCLSAFLAGVINSLAGGGTLLTFPALLAVTGPLVANATSTVALVPGSVAGAWGYRRELRGTGKWLWLLTGPSLLGGLVGALLVVQGGESWFKVLIPYLILTSALLFLFQPALNRLLPRDPQVLTPSVWVRLGVAAAQFVIAVYGGYFGAGIGILMLTSLSFMGIGDVRRINAVKTFLAAWINGVAIVVFVWFNQVRWDLAAIMAAAAIAGGYTGAVLGRRLPRELVRWFVVVVGLGLAGYYFWQQWREGAGR